VRLVGGQKEIQISQVAIMMGAERVTVGEVPAGNIAGLIGLKDVWAGETISSKEGIHRFESFMSAVEPVMTVSVEAKNPKDLPKLIEVIRKITKEDPNVHATINQETGEHLLSGMGELHLEITQYRIEVDNKLPVKVGNPIVVFHEGVSRESPEIEGKSPNRHNKFKITVEPIKPAILEKLAEAKIDTRVRAKDKDILQTLSEIGFTKEEVKEIWAIHNNCILLNTTRGIQYLNETKELVIQAFEDAVSQGPMAQEKCSGILVSLNDATLHEDAVHRGPAQVLPAVTRAILACILSANPILREPKQTLTITVPQDFMGNALNELAQRRTQIKEMRQEGELSIIIAKAPVKELIGFSATMRGATQGRAMWTAEYAGYENMPHELQIQTVKEIRKRKGLPEALRKAEDFMD
jgi:elongation factor 2